jgi:hypothetical protein
MTRHHKATKADKKSRSKKPTEPNPVHHGRSTSEADCAGVPGVAGDKHEHNKHQTGKDHANKPQHGKHQHAEPTSDHRGGKHQTNEQRRPLVSDQPQDVPSDLDMDHDALAAGDADQLLRRPPRRRAAPIGPPLGDHVEATAD